MKVFYLLYLDFDEAARVNRHIKDTAQIKKKNIKGVCMSKSSDKDEKIVPGQLLNFSKKDMLRHTHAIYTT